MTSGSVNSTYTNGYISPETFLNKREIRREVFDKYNERSLIDMLWHSKRKQLADNTRFNHFEHDYLYSYVQQAGAASGTSSAGNPVTITAKVISPAETEGPGSWAETSYSTSPFKVGDLVLIGAVRGWITAVNKTTAGAHTFTAYPVDQNDNIVAAASADLYIPIFSNGKSDGSGMPGSMVRKPILYFNYTQIFANNFTSNGSVATNKAEVNVQGKPYWYLQGAVDASLKHLLDMEFNFIINHRSDGLTDPNNDNEETYMNGGLDWYGSTYGNNLNYTSGSFAYSNLEAAEKALSGDRAAKHALYFNGLDINIEMDDAIKGKLDNSGSANIDWSVFGDGDGEQRAVDWGIDGFRFSNRNYMKKEMEFLNYGPVTGYSGGDWKQRSYLIPIGTIKNPKPKNERDEYLDTISIRYKANDRGARFIEHWVRDKRITNQDKLEFNYQTEAGLHMVGTSQMVRFTPS